MNCNNLVVELWLMGDKSQLLGKAEANGAKATLMLRAAVADTNLEL